MGDSIEAIYKFKGIEDLLKWVDNFVFFRYACLNESGDSWHYNYDADLIWKVAETLGWPWAPAKFFDFSHTFSYVGFVWDLDSKTVRISEDKCKEFIERMSTWKEGALVTKRDCEVLVGTLNHCALVLPDGRSRLPSLYRLSGSFANKHRLARHRVSKVVSSDVDWWRMRLSSGRCTLVIGELPAPSPFEIYVDASTSWGIGCVMDSKWLAWRLKPGWKTDGRDIGWAEMVAVLLALTALVARGISNAHFILRSDNQGVCGALEGGKLRNEQQNLILCHTVNLFRDHGIWFTIKWVASANNEADSPSWGLLPPVEDLFPLLPALPFFLKPIVEKPIRRETYNVLRVRS